MEVEIVWEAYAANILSQRHPVGPFQGNVPDKMVRMVGKESSYDSSSS